MHPHFHTLNTVSLCTLYLDTPNKTDTLSSICYNIYCPYIYFTSAWWPLAITALLDKHTYTLHTNLQVPHSEM